MDALPNPVYLKPFLARLRICTMLFDKVRHVPYARNLLIRICLLRVTTPAYNTQHAHVRHEK